MKSDMKSWIFPMLFCILWSSIYQWIPIVCLCSYSIKFMLTIFKCTCIYRFVKLEIPIHLVQFFSIMEVTFHICSEYVDRFRFSLNGPVLAFHEVICWFINISLLALYVNKAKLWVDSWHPYLIISRTVTDQEKNGCQFFH